MDISSIPLLDVLTQRMSWLNARQTVLSQNVVNADTPGYQAKDLKPADFTTLLKGSTAIAGSTLRLAATSPSHLSGTLPVDAYKQQVSADTQANPTGNTVGLEQEMIKVADTQAQYQAASSLYAKAVAMTRTAIGQP